MRIPCLYRTFQNKKCLQIKTTHLECKDNKMNLHITKHDKICSFQHKNAGPVSNRRLFQIQIKEFTYNETVNH